ncbi:MAG TPA: SRPBCC family protein [Opitutaceae bacterium]|nr:SRPBCC family protein [Opitutaceae bacterium]
MRAVTIRKPASELYAFWRDIENLERVIEAKVSITAVSADESHWKVTMPTGIVEWHSLIINDKPGALIAWRSREGTDVPNAGSVRFDAAPGGEGTEVTVALEYDPPGGKLGKLIAKLSGEDAGLQVDIALKRLKALMEADEIPTTKKRSVSGPKPRRKGKNEAAALAL